MQGWPQGVRDSGMSRSPEPGTKRESWLTDALQLDLISPRLRDDPDCAGEKATALCWVRETAWPSAVEWGDRGLVDGHDQRTRSLAATTSVAPVKARHCVMELAHKIVNRLGLDVDAKELVKSRHAFPGLIKAFSIKLGLSGSETDLDAMYFVHKYHR